MVEKEINLSKALKWNNLEHIPEGNINIQGY